MGDPKRFKKKYFPPLHPWNKRTIEEEAKLTKEYGLGKKKEIYIANSLLKKYKDIAKRLIADATEQGKKEKQQMLQKLQRLGLLTTGADLDQVLGLQLKDVLERRIQSQVYRKGLARSMKQARQFIVHRHITVGGKEITSPTFLLTIVDQQALGFKGTSALAAEDHPERVVVTAPVKEVQKSKNEETKATEEVTAGETAKEPAEA